MFRDQYIFRLLVARARRGDRVFAVIGASHVVVREPALLMEFGQPATKVHGLP
jgi:pheromone shutdown protein TraB